MSILTGLYYFEVHILKSVNSQNNVPAPHPKQEEEDEKDDNKNSITKPTDNNNNDNNNSSPSSSTNKKGGIRIGLTSISALTQFNVSTPRESIRSRYLSYINRLLERLSIMYSIIDLPSLSLGSSGNGRCAGKLCN